MSTGGLSIAVNVEQSLTRLARLLAKVQNRRPLMAAVGKRGEVELRRHAADRNSEPNRKGWPRTNFWSRRIRANTVLSEVTESSAVVDIAAPEIRQKVYGGTITPQGGRKFLAIPARAEAYGKSPLSFANLRFVFTGKGKGMLVADDAIQGPTQRGQKRIAKKQTGAAYYFLVKSVTQNPDPRALPNEAEFYAALVREAEAFLARQLGGTTAAA